MDTRHGMFNDLNILRNYILSNPDASCIPNAYVCIARSNSWNSPSSADSLTAPSHVSLFKLLSACKPILGQIYVFYLFLSWK